MGQSKSQTLPILPLPRGSVLLPGVSLRIPVSGRSDVLSLLSSIYTQARNPKPDATTVPIGCVPLTSSLLSPDGQQLIDNGDIHSEDRSQEGYVGAAYAGKKDLFNYGTVARISGVHGRRPHELTLIVDGIKRFKIDRITQEKPFFEAAVSFPDKDGI